MTCERYGATLEDGAFCKHCGARVLRPKDVGADADHRTAPERFELAQQAPGYELARSHSPRASAKAEIVIPAFVGAFAVVFLIVSQAGRSGNMHTPAWFRIAFVIVPLLMIGFAVTMVARGMKFSAAPITKELLVVVDERVAVSGGSNNSSAHTTYYATLQDRGGARLEYQTHDWLAGRASS